MKTKLILLAILSASKIQAAESTMGAGEIAGGTLVLGGTIVLGVVLLCLLIAWIIFPFIVKNRLDGILKELHEINVRAEVTAAELREIRNVQLGLSNPAYASPEAEQPA